MQTAIKVFAALIVIGAPLAPTSALADATLHAGSNTLFPNRIDIASEVKAQVEITTITLDFGDVDEYGDFVLTVPSPDGASPIGVDLDKGDGFEALPISGQTPPPGVSSGPQASAAVQAWEGKTPLLASLNDLEPGSLRARVRFMRLLRRHAASVVFEVGAGRCPLRELSSDPTVTIAVALETLRPLAEVSVQGVSSKVSQPSPLQAAFTYGPAPLSANARATISYKEKSSGIASRFLAHRTSDADPLGGAAGYFLLLIDADKAGASASPPRTLNLVIDRSGSMLGDKIEQARDAALAMLENLRPTDRFNIHTFAKHTESLYEAPVLASGSRISAATTFVHALSAAGATDLNAGILAGLGEGCAASKEGRFDAMVLLSDGMATSGVTHPATIHKNAINNCNESRIFTFAIGQDADAALLEALARSSRAKSFTLNDAQASTELGGAVRELFEDIYAVRLTDITLSLDGSDTHDVLPEKARDLFDGGQVLVVGRYDTPGRGSARIRARAAGNPFVRELAFSAPNNEPENAFIKYLWATEMVGALLAKLGSGTGDAQLIQKEITDIGLAYNIQTPYTSFVSSAPPPSYGSHGSSSGSSSSGYSGSSGGGDGGMGDIDPISLTLLALLVPAIRRRRRKPR